MSGGTLGAVREPAGARIRGVRVPRWSAPAWGAIAVATLFVALTCWWLSVDRSVPYNDAAQNLFYAFRYHDLLEQGARDDVDRAARASAAHRGDRPAGGRDE